MGMLMVLIVLLVAATSGGSDQDQDDIVLGLLIPFSGQWQVGRYIAGAMTIAVNDINRNSNILPGRNVSFLWNDTHCSGKNGLYEAVNLWLHVGKLHAFIGGGCDVVCEPVGLLASAWNLPMISWGCSSLLLSNKEDYNTFVRTVGPYTKMAPMFTEIMHYYKWKRVAILTSSENVWQTTSYAVKLDLEKNNITVSEFVTFSPGYETIVGQEELQHNQLIKGAKDSARIFMLFANGGDIRDIMLIALDLGMLNGDYAFICVDLTDDAHYGRNTWMGEDGRDDDASQAFNGLLNIHIKTPLVDHYEEFETEVRARVAEAPFNRAMLEHEKVDVHAGPLYDAVILYANGLHDVLAQGGDQYDGIAIAKMMRNRKFIGVDGNVTIDHAGDRDPDYALQNIHDNKFDDIASYAHETKMLTFREGFTPTWPGGGNITPKGEPKCGWELEKCQTNTVGIIAGVLCSVFVLVLVAGGVAAYFYRRLKMEAELQSINLWRVNYDDVVFDTRKTLSNFSEQGLTPTLSNGQLSLGNNSRMSGGRQTSSSNCTDIQKFCNYALYKGCVVAIRNVRKKAITLSRDMLIEIATVRNFKHENINPFIGVCIDHPHICILMEYSNKGSLQDVLENDDIKLDDNFKLSFTMDICKGMQYLFGTPLKSHGRLKSSNVVVDKRWACKLTDYGLALFKGGQADYLEESEHDMYKASLWTAPELLRCPPASPYGTPEGDIYSFGIILQEIVLRGGPYCSQMIDPKEIVTAVKMGARPVFRPVVPSDACSSKMMELIELCWAEQATDRPNISKIKSMIQKLSGGKAQNLVDNMIGMMEKYADHLEELVNERTLQLEDEKKKTDQLLHQMLPRSVAAQLKRGDVVTAEQYEQVTVYFSDIVGFTKLASESTPFQVVELLNDLYTVFDDTIDNYDIYKVETIGDAYMVASGVPELNGNRHAAEIGSLALDLLWSVKSFKIRHRPKEQLQLRTGVHTGPVVAGVVGQKMPRFCLFGDTVNTASRMESNGLALRIHISSTTCAVLNQVGGFKIELRGEISVKGKAPMTTYWLMGKDASEFDLPDLCLDTSPSDLADDLPGAVTPDKHDA